MNIVPRYYLILSAVLFFIQCTNDSSTQALESDTNSIQVPSLDTISSSKKKEFSFICYNETPFQIDLIFNGGMLRFQDPGSEDYLFIGKNPILFLDQKYFQVGDKVLALVGDTAIIINSGMGRVGSSQNPIVFINYQYPKKYLSLKNEFVSRKFGKVRLLSQGKSCEDSFSGVVEIEYSGKSLKLQGLANLDLFESKNGELFVLSYHNCLLTNLKIIRIR